MSPRRAHKNRVLNRVQDISGARPLRVVDNVRIGDRKPGPLVTFFAGKDIDEAQPSQTPMQFWMREL
jgi:hypothetical protein